jgi:hypothetical protein
MLVGWNYNFGITIYQHLSRTRISKSEELQQVKVCFRFPDREQLRCQIWDAGLTNADTVMPPFGKHQILTPDEIELIVDYLYTL